MDKTTRKITEVRSTFTDKEKEKLINKEIVRLNGICKEMDEEKSTLAKSLIEEAAFMSITLLDLRKLINDKGCVSFYQNSEFQWGTKKSPEVEIYNSMIKNFMQIKKQIIELLPEENAKDNAGEAIMRFVSGGK